MWTVQPEDQYARRYREFETRHAGVLLALLNNLDTYHRALSDGQQPMNIRAGFLHPEKHHGLAAVDTKGAATKQPAARLYFYPDTETHVLHLLCIGFKKTQKKDLRACRRLVDRIRGGRSDG